MKQLTRSGLWLDGEFLCHWTADQVETIAWRFRRLGGRCHRNSLKVKRQH